MNAFHVDLSRYQVFMAEQEAFDALIEEAQEDIAEETERLYLAMYDWEEKPVTDEAKKLIRDFAYKKAYFCVIRDKQEEVMNQQYRQFIREMQAEFEKKAHEAGMTVEEYEDFELECETA